MDAGQRLSQCGLLFLLRKKFFFVLIGSCMLWGETSQHQLHFHKMQQKPASITVFLCEVVSSAHGGGPLFFCMRVMKRVPEHVVFNIFPAPRWSSMVCVCVYFTCVLAHRFDFRRIPAL